MTQTRRGRPAEFRNAADKQKAYRARKKQAEAEAEALRKSEWEKSPEGLRVVIDRLDADRTAHLARLSTMYQWSTDIDKDYQEWLKQDIAMCDLWWKAHVRWYDAWKNAGFPIRK